MLATLVASFVDSSSMPPTTRGIVFRFNPGLSNQSRLGATATKKSLGTCRPDFFNVSIRILSHWPGASVDSTIIRSGPFSTFFALSFFETSKSAPSHGFPFLSVGMAMKWTFVAGSSSISLTFVVACIKPFFTNGPIENPSHCCNPVRVILPLLISSTICGARSYPMHLIPRRAK